MTDDAGFTPLFNGTDLTGWRAIPRNYGTLYPGGPRVVDAMPIFPADYNEQADRHPAVWSVQDGVIVGRQERPGGGWGGYLITEESYGDFELRLEMKPDWPADTGVMIRRRPDSWAGLQVLVDHRRSGSIGGFYGNGIGGFHAVPYALTAREENGVPVGLALDDPETSLEPFDPAKAAMLTSAGSAQEFLDAWRWGDWNELTVRCVGALPRVTTWVNGVAVAEIDMSTLEAADYRPDDVAAVLGDRGHIALEVHDNDPMLGDLRWAPGAACRWRNLRLRRL